MNGENMTQKKVRLAFAGACLMALTATACSSDDAASSDTGAPAASAATGAGGTTAAAPAGGAGMTISGFAFSPASVAAGTEFTITNNDSAAHTVTDDGGTFDVAVPAGGTANLTIPAAGTFAIHCKIHAAMTGTITVA
jgi:plastocyanin